jgi:hypothetical protein
MARPDSPTLPIPLLPQRHGLTSTTFRPPLLDGSLTLGEICDFHLINSPDHVVFVYHSDDGTMKEILWKDFVPAIHRAGRYVIESFGIDPTTTELPTIAILAMSGMYQTHQSIGFLFVLTHVGWLRQTISLFLLLQLV